jgi:hypothetical protein
MVARVATRSPSGGAFVTPLWFVVDAGLVLASTGAASVTVRNLRACPEVVVLFDADRGPREDRALRLRGLATAHERLPGWRAIARFALKYYLAPGGLRCELAHARRWALRLRYYGQASPAVVAITPQSAEWAPRPPRSSGAAPPAARSRDAAGC